jgi:hypothetical protein
MRQITTFTKARQANGPSQWAKPMGQANGPSQWAKPMGQANGPSQWAKPIVSIIFLVDFSS